MLLCAFLTHPDAPRFDVATLQHVPSYLELSPEDRQFFTQDVFTLQVGVAERAEPVNLTAFSVDGTWQLELAEIMNEQEANDAAAKRNIRNALTASKVYYTDAQHYTADLEALKAIEDRVPYAAGVASPTSEPEVVYVVVSGAKEEIVCLTARSRTGQMFGLKDIATGPNAETYYDQGSGIPATCDDSPWGAQWTE
jgi:hypothetical protein